MAAFERAREDTVRPVLVEFGEPLKRPGYIYLVSADPNSGSASGPSIELRLGIRGARPVTLPQAPGIKFDANRSRGVVIVSITGRAGLVVDSSQCDVEELSADLVRRETLRAMELIFG